MRWWLPWWQGFMRLNQRRGHALCQYGAFVCLHACVCMCVCVCVCPPYSLPHCPQAGSKVVSQNGETRMWLDVTSNPQPQIYALSPRLCCGAGSLTEHAAYMTHHGGATCPITVPALTFFFWGYPPTLGFLTSLIWPTKQTTSRSPCLCVLSLMP